MKIIDIETIVVAIPYQHDGAATGFGGTIWRDLSFLLIKVTTDEGLTGWGEAFGYNAIPATRTAMLDIVKPLAIGQAMSLKSIASSGRALHDVPEFMDRLKKPLHLFGRSGPVFYALSGLDIALWDLAAKYAGVSIGRLLSDHPRPTVPAYKSFMRLIEPSVVARATERAAMQGYQKLKLHEIAIDAVAAAREAAGPDVALMLDVNCAWPADEAIHQARLLQPFGLKWLEEPIWPPEDIEGIARLRKSVEDIPLALGENVANASAFMPLLYSGVVDYYQPSITKAGGITEFIAVAEAAVQLGRAVAPHSPYFGPGLLATLQMASAYRCIDGIEIFGVELDATLFGGRGMPDVTGMITIPDGPGLGCDPDQAILARYGI